MDDGAADLDGETSTGAAVRQGFTRQRPAPGIRCPQCKKRALRKAKRQGFTDRLAGLVLLRRYRCRYCRYSELRFLFERR